MSIFSLLGKITRTALRLRGFRYETRLVDGIPVHLWQRQIARAVTSEQTMVMVPGFGDSPISWVPLVLALLGRLKGLGVTRLVLLELPGGLGAKHQGSGVRTARQLFGVVRGVVDELKPRFLVGQSMGGFLVAHYAAHQQPTWLHKIVIMCPSGLLLANTEKGKWMTVLDEVSAGKPEAFVKKAVGPIASNPLLGLPARAFGHELRTYLMREDVREHMQSYVPGDEMDDVIKHIPYPTLLVWGEGDILVPYFLFEEWKARLTSTPRAAEHRYVSVPKVSHGVHIEAAPRVADEIISFLK